MTRSRLLAATVLIVIFLAFFSPLTSGVSDIGPQNDLEFSAHNATLSPAFHAATAKLAGNATNAGTASEAYDEQVGMTFTQTFTNLTYNVTAVKQQDSEGVGPAYLLNGLTSKGYWYQVGISWNWAQLSGGYIPGFHMNYNVFDSTGAVVLPASQTGGAMDLTGSVNQGDIVSLNLVFSSGNVVMSVYDWNTKATAQISYSAQGSSRFVGLSTPANSNGFFTGLMTEQYHNSPYYGTMQKVVYSNSRTALSSGILWIDEYNVNTHTLLFGGSKQVDFTSNPTLFQTYSLQGATVSANADNMVTGSGNFIQLTLSYSVTGGSGFTAPMFSFKSNGFQQSVELTTSPTIYAVDTGSPWSITKQLMGSTSTERWIANQPVNGVASTNQTISFYYYHQYLVIFNYSVIGGGIGYSLPSVTAMQFGSKIQPALNQQIWIDEGSQYSYTNPLVGSTQSERWWVANSNISEIVTTSGLLNHVYDHQYFLTLQAIEQAGGSLSPLSGWINAGENVQISGVANEGWKFESWTGSGSGSYSGSSTVTTIKMEGPIVENGTFYVGLVIATSGHGSVSYSLNNSAPSKSTGQTLYVPYGSVVTLSAHPSLFLYKLNSWSGTASGISSKISINVTSPVNVQANFGYDPVVIGIIGGAFVIVFIVVVAALARRKRGRNPGSATLRALGHGIVVAISEHLLKQVSKSIFIESSQSLTVPKEEIYKKFCNCIGGCESIFQI